MKKYGYQQSNSDHTLFLKRRGNDEEEMRKLKTNLFTEFELKNLGRLKYFLGIELVDTPTRVNHKLHMEEEAELTNKERYQRLVGKLIYLSYTRPDIAYAVGVISKFMHQPQVSHMEAVMRIIRYLKGTVGHGVLFRPNKHLKVQLYTYADWAGDKDDGRSTSGYFTLVSGNLVTWKSKK
ncbi:secreted RxLR effector protein 161-like [Bidens hawaiensis]|uniref:secreted RxLR effector protein 161-like n=1 Tax=Bidens hawaiensis TaxID=980011 RepID=UPI004048FB84